MIVWAVTLLPEPDSPTIATHLAGGEVEGDAVDGRDGAVLGREGDREVAHGKKGSGRARRPGARGVPHR